MRDESIVLEFDSVGSGLTAARSRQLDAFAIAGKDRTWHWADAEINGHTVVVKRAMGSTQSIMVTEQGLFGASDPRRAGALTVGY